MTRLIVAVCRGNIGRSPFAEAIIKQELQHEKIKGIEVTSRGIQGTTIDPEPVKYPNITYYKELYEDAEPTLARFHIDLSKHKSRPIDGEDAELADILLAMDSKTANALKSLFPAEAHKVHRVSELIGKDNDIEDPEGVSGADKQTLLFTDLRETLIAGFPMLLELLDRTKVGH